MRVSQRLYITATIILVVVIFSLLILSQQVRPISADALVKQIKDDGTLLKTDQIIYSQWHITQRVKPLTFNKIADPYHLPPEPELAAFTMERWSQKFKDGHIRWIVRSFDDNNTLIEATSFDDGLVKHYDRASNVFVSSTISDQPSSTINVFNPQVLGSTDTVFGSSWIVLLYSDQVTSDMGDTTPYYADLQPKTYEKIALTQKETMRVVQWTTQIRTIQDDIIPIRAEVLVSSNIKQNNANDTSIFRLDAPIGSTDVGQDVPLPVIPSSTWNTISDAQAALPFNIIVPNEVKANVIFQNIYANVSSAIESQPKKQIFDIQDAARNGEAIEIHYLSADSKISSECIETANACSKKTLVFIEGPRSLLSQQMKRQRLLWDESRLVEMQLAHETVSGYIATGGAFQQADQIAFFAEVGNTFICIIGQHYTQQELLSIVSTLQQTQQ